MTVEDLDFSTHLNIVGLLGCWVVEFVELLVAELLSCWWESDVW